MSDPIVRTNSDILPGYTLTEPTLPQIAESERRVKQANGNPSIPYHYLSGSWLAWVVSIDGITSLLRWSLMAKHADVANDGVKLVALVPTDKWTREALANALWDLWKPGESKNASGPVNNPAP